MTGGVQAALLAELQTQVVAAVVVRRRRVCSKMMVIRRVQGRVLASQGH
jgi:hypothetical protein